MSDSDSDSAPSSPVAAPAPAPTAASPAKKQKHATKKPAASAASPAASASAASPAKGDKKQKTKKGASVVAKKAPKKTSELSFIMGTHRMIDNRATHPELRSITISSNGNALVSAFIKNVLKRVLAEHQRLVVHGDKKVTMTPFTIQRSLAAKLPLYTKMDACQAFCQQRLDQYTRSLTPAASH